MPTEDLYPPRLRQDARFIETWAVVGGALLATERHLERMARTLSVFASPKPSRLLAEAQETLASAIATLTEEDRPRTHRLTLTYTPEGVEAVRLVPYTFRTIRRLIPMELPSDFDYTYKYADRGFFCEASAGLATDEEPIFYRPSGLLTDTTFTNLVLDLPEGLLTPRTPLLAGTRWAALLDAGRIREADLTLDDLHRARAFHLINALRPLPEI